ncbi:glycosyltransferase family 2 protein [Streptomyces sp. NPDC054796]
MNRPLKVSVVVPTYNTGRTVLDGLRSLREQSMDREDFEVLYVDDGSTDDTAALLESALADEPHMRLIRTTNSGWPGRPRNIGTDAARGEYVHYLDDDDWLAPKALEKLYARARETGADIVIGRMAGHGRGAPRAPFAKPMAHGDFRKDTVLAGSMTVHKLFRRAFLTDHALRFAEGRVRLEDHLFMLRAYLLASGVATVHDYTCYHWVRHRDGLHNISYQRIEPAPYVDSIRRVLAVLDAPDTHVPPGPLRERLLANWYGNKALRRLTGKGLLMQPGDYRDAWFGAVSSLAADLPPEADAHLPARLRVLSALARHGDLSLLEDFAVFEANIDHLPRLISAEWDGPLLTVKARTRLMHRAVADRPAAPVVFTRDAEDTRDTEGGEGGFHWRLPHALTAVPGVPEAADFTDEVRHGKATGLLRHREDRTEIAVHGTSRLVELPLGPDEADPDAAATAAPEAPGPAGLLARAARRLGLTSPPDEEAPPSRNGQGRALCYEAEFTIDPATADQGGPLAPGTWDVLLRLNTCGWLSAPRLRGVTVEGVREAAEAEAERVPST